MSHKEYRQKKAQKIKDRVKWGDKIYRIKNKWQKYIEYRRMVKKKPKEYKIEGPDHFQHVR